MWALIHSEGCCMQPAILLWNRKTRPSWPTRLSVTLNWAARRLNMLRECGGWLQSRALSSVLFSNRNAQDWPCLGYHDGHEQTRCRTENVKLCTEKGGNGVFGWPATCPISEKSKRSSLSAHNVVYLTFAAVFPRMNARGLRRNAKIFHSDTEPSTHLDFTGMGLNLEVLCFAALEDFCFFFSLYSWKKKNLTLGGWKWYLVGPSKGMEDDTNKMANQAEVDVPFMKSKSRQFVVCGSLNICDFWLAHLYLFSYGFWVGLVFFGLVTLLTLPPK